MSITPETKHPDVDHVAAPQFFRGEWLRPGDAGYEERRGHYNTRFDRRPTVVARCQGAQDVRAALRVAHEQGWEVAVRGGGRGFAGHSTIEDGMLIDLSLMNDVHVDASRRVARVGPGATQGDVLRETVPRGLAPITGTSSHIGFVGVAIYSGTGHLSPRHGYSCDWVLSADVVLADGTLVTASADSHPDLFWALRGAGDNFGVVVSIETMLHPVPETVTLATWSWSGDRLDELMRLHRDWEKTISEDVFLTADLSYGYTDDGLLHFELIMVHLGDAAAVARDVAAVDAFGIDPEHRQVGDIDWVTLHHTFDDYWPSCRQYWASGDLVAISDASLDLMLDQAREMGDRAGGRARLMLAYYTYHHAMLRHVAAPAAAMDRREGCELIAIAMYDEPADDERVEAWAEDFIGRFRDAGLLLPGAMPNYTTRVDMVQTWGEHYGRLARLKARWDPENLFRHNANIPPQPPASEAGTPKEVGVHD